jgi:hypothetical protein
MGEQGSQGAPPSAEVFLGLRSQLLHSDVQFRVQHRKLAGRVEVEITRPPVTNFVCIRT